MKQGENGANKEEDTLLQGLEGDARKKLLKWLDMEPMDYDAPGSTARETGV